MGHYMEMKYKTVPEFCPEIYLWIVSERISILQDDIIITIKGVKITEASSEPRSLNGL